MDRTRVQVVSDVKCGRLQVNCLRKIVTERLLMLSFSSCYTYTVGFFSLTYFGGLFVHLLMYFFYKVHISVIFALIGLWCSSNL